MVFIYLLISFMFFYTVGHCLLSILFVLDNIIDSRSVFSKLFVGILVTISIYSFLKTSFITINVCFFLIALFYLFNSKSIFSFSSENIWNFKKDLKVLYRIPIIITGVYCLYYFNISDIALASGNTVIIRNSGIMLKNIYILYTKIIFFEKFLKKKKNIFDSF